MFGSTHSYIEQSSSVFLASGRFEEAPKWRTQGVCEIHEHYALFITLKPMHSRCDTNRT